jgi:hypothetical protein
MIYKYNFSISGDCFDPEKVIERIQGDFIIVSSFRPTDKKFLNSSEEYGYGNISFWHKRKFSTDGLRIQYENDFIEFIVKNHSLFIENGANEFDIFLEIYFDGGQCNFEIFNKELLKKLSNIGVSLPISVYVLKRQKFNKWENEIKLDWSSI